MRAYKPKRANKQWQEQAPEYILDCFDNKGQSVDRYTVLFGGTLWESNMGRKVQALAMSDSPTNPSGGVSMWITVDADWRPAHRRVRWLDLPEHIRQHVIDRATEE